MGVPGSRELRAVGSHMEQVLGVESRLDRVTLSCVSRSVSAPDAERARSNILRRCASKRQREAAVWGVQVVGTPILTD